MKIIIQEDQIVMEPESRHDIDVLNAIKHSAGVERVQVTDPNWDGNDVLILTFRKDDWGT